MDGTSGISVAWRAFRSAVLDGMKHVPSWAVLIEITVVLCCLVRPEYMLVAATVVLLAAILKAGHFNEKYERLNKNNKHEE